MAKVVLLDGGMGQELIHRSAHPPHPLWSAKVLLDEPEIVEAVHREYIQGGARVITLNNYSVTPERLERDGDVNLFSSLQKQAVQIAERARDKTQTNHGGDIRLAGSLPPLYGSYHPEFAPDFDECLSRYQIIADVQAGQVDLLICETMSSIKEGRAAAIAAIKTGLPTWLSYSLEDSDAVRLRSQEPLKEAIEAVSDLGLDAILLNCSSPEAINAAIDTLVDNYECVGTYANGFSSIENMKIGGTVTEVPARQDLGAEQYAEFAMRWIEAGVRIIGGCCEIGPSHIAYLHDLLLNTGYEVDCQL